MAQHPSRRLDIFVYTSACTVCAGMCLCVYVCEGEAHMCTVFVQGSEDYLWLGEYPKDRDSMGVRSPHYVIPLSLI